MIKIEIKPLTQDRKEFNNMDKISIFIAMLLPCVHLVPSHTVDGATKKKLLSCAFQWRTPPHATCFRETCTMSEQKRFNMLSRLKNTLVFMIIGFRKYITKENK